MASNSTSVVSIKRPAAIDASLLDFLSTPAASCAMISPMRSLSKPEGKSAPAPGQTLNSVRSRARPARSAVLQAFAELIGAKQYEEIAIGEIIRRARVSRSTFYEHFSGKQGLLTQSIAGPFKILADGLLHAQQPKLVPLLEH